MGYMIVSDRLDMGDFGKHEFGFAPKHPIMDEAGTHVVGYSPGKRYAEHPDTGLPETFEWLGDQDEPPNWCSPADPEAEEAYKRQAGRAGDTLKRRIVDAKAALELLEAQELELEIDAKPEYVEKSERAADPMSKARAAKKAKASLSAD